MKYGFVLPYGDAKVAADFAHEAEAAGWDGFFVWEPVWGVDAWVALTAAAMRTERIKLGTMLTPIARMKPWKLASETATLDHLSGGRLILAIGLGAPETGYAEFGEVIDRKTRAELTDEGLAVLTGLWRGQPFEFHGKHYRVWPFDRFVAPMPVQKPRIPIWAVGVAGRTKSMARVAKYDGLVPNVIGADGVPRNATPDELKGMVTEVMTLRIETTPFDVIAEGETPGDDLAKAAEIITPWQESGATWWLEARWSAGGPEGVDAVRQRLRQGPPR
jgi:hypothetical protein